MAAPRRQRRAGGVTTRFFEPAPTSVTLPSPSAPATPAPDLRGFGMSGRSVSPTTALTRAYANIGFMPLSMPKLGRDCDVPAFAARVDSPGPRTAAPWDRPNGSSRPPDMEISSRAARRAQWQAKGVRQGLTDTVSSIKSVASMHSMMASSRPPPSPTRVRPIPNHEASGYNLAPAFVPSSSSVAPASTGLSVRPLLTQSLRAAPLRDHARGHGGGPVGAASKLAMAQWVSGGGGGGGDGGGDRPEALLGAIQGGFAHREVGRIGLGVGELQARRDAGALGSFDPWHARDAPAAAEAFLGRRSMEGPLPSTDPPNSKFRPHHPSALPAFQESLRPSGLVRPPRGAIQAQREAGHGAGAGYVGYGHSMNVGSTIRYAEPGTAGFAEASETFRGEKPFGRVPADPTTLPPARDRAAAAIQAAATFERRAATLARYEHVAHEEAEKQLVFSQANLFGHRTATEAYARSVARRQDMNQAFFANQDPEVRYSGLGKFGRNAEAPSAGRGVLRVPFGTDA